MGLKYFGRDEAPVLGEHAVCERVGRAKRRGVTRRVMRPAGRCVCVCGHERRARQGTAVLRERAAVAQAALACLPRREREGQAWEGGARTPVGDVSRARLRRRARSRTCARAHPHWLVAQAAEHSWPKAGQKAWRLCGRRGRARPHLGRALASRASPRRACERPRRALHTQRRNPHVAQAAEHVGLQTARRGGWRRARPRWHERAERVWGCGGPRAPVGHGLVQLFFFGQRFSSAAPPG